MDDLDMLRGHAGQGNEDDDGLGRLQTMFRISLPLVWPGIVTAIVFVFVNTWNEYAAALILVQQTNLQPLTVAMPRFLGLYCDIGAVEGH